MILNLYAIMKMKKRVGVRLVFLHFLDVLQTLTERTTPVRFQRAMYNEEYLEYDKRCVVLKHVVVVAAAVCLIPLPLIIIAIGIDYMWLHLFTGQ